MNAHRFVFIIILAFLCRSAALFAAESRPNILFIFLDDFGWKDASYMGSDFYETPHIDRLASEGMIFTDAYSAAANCAPARACLLSGQYAPRHQIYNVGTRPRGDKRFRKLEHVSGTAVLDPKIKTWAQVAQETGYRTATIGKWHLSNDPIPYGFDVNIGGGASGSPPKGYYPPHPRVPRLENALEDEYLTDRLTNEAVRFIRGTPNRPWLLYLTHFAVHTPLHAKRELIAKYEAKAAGKLHHHVTMATMIQAVDDGVGRIRAVLEELDLLQNTIVIFFSDNGGYGPATDMDPLKGYKGTYYEGGIRVPFFVRWPGVVAPGSRSGQPIIGVDLYPTLCAMMKTPGPNQVLDGLNLVPLLREDVSTLGARALYWHFPAYLQAYSVVHEQRDPLFRSRPCSVIRKGSWKLHHYFEDDGVELYHLPTDIGERYDLSALRPRLVSELMEDLDAWRDATNAAIPEALNPDYDANAESAAVKKALN
ncbi:MAG: Arylsulfatase [Verrucomicrobia subdivision 3 bacterium]|nr:Arylsulfatase [Limisphaerales bacterium]MCS1413902.1 Arylsulfatase [Limisphaerales bacterium]